MDYNLSKTQESNCELAIGLGRVAGAAQHREAGIFGELWVGLGDLAEEELRAAV
jgi:hypothetical protein